MEVAEETTNSVDLDLSQLPPGGKCIAEIYIENQNGKSDQTQQTFDVPE